MIVDILDRHDPRQFGLSGLFARVVEPRSGARCATSSRSWWIDAKRHSGARVSANPESRDSPMRNCASEVWTFGPSRNDEQQKARSFDRAFDFVEIS
jgi:hypothetical protein